MAAADTAWPDHRILDLFGIELPIVQAPMANSSTPEMALAVRQAGGLGSIPCASITADQARAAVALVRRAGGPVNLNFFCHTPPEPDPARMMAWRARLAPYYVEAGLDPAPPPPIGGRAPFDEAFCAIVEETKPEVVSFHFGLPDKALLARVKATGAKVISSATTVAEAVWLEQRGVDAVIATGFEAGGHRGTFLGELDMSTQPGTFALVPQVVSAVKVPVIAAGGIADGRGIAAAFALGASAVQVGTAYLFCPEAMLSPIQRALLDEARDDNTQTTNLFTGRPARGVTNRLMRELGALSDAPPFPTAGGTVQPLRAKAESQGSGEFTNQWAGQSARLSPRLPAGELTKALAADAMKQLERLTRSTSR